MIECYQRVAAGQPQFVLLQGETGIGKTHLALAAFTPEERQRYVHALAWVEQPVEVRNNGSVEGYPDRRESSTLQAVMPEFLKRTEEEGGNKNDSCLVDMLKITIYRYSGRNNGGTTS